MNISSFLKLVEIRTKVASIIPFTIGSLFTIYRYKTVDIHHMIIFFISMISIDMATTAINNFMDYKRAIKKDGYNYEEHNAMVKNSLSDTSAVLVIVTLLTIATIAGFILFLNTDWVVLFLGVVSFFIGIIYSFGPIPISRTPLGELLSGFVMGAIILFISIYIHIYNESIVSVTFSYPTFSLNLNLIELGVITLLAIPLVLMIANIMLANNICDLEDDIQNRRYTLPYYLGNKLSLILYTMMYIFTFIGILIGVVIKVFPLFSLAVLITAIPVFKNVKLFYNEQSKRTTFIYSVKNFMLVSIIWVLSLITSIIYY